MAAPVPTAITIARPRARATRGVVRAHGSTGAFVSLFTAGWFVTPLQASVTTLLQTNLPPQLRGRTQAAFATLVSGASLASMSLGGAGAAITGIRPVLALAGLLVAAAGLASHAAFRRVPAGHPAATVEVS